jgi:hypothetical protein
LVAAAETSSKLVALVALVALDFLSGHKRLSICRDRSSQIAHSKSEKLAHFCTNEMFWQGNIASRQLQAMTGDLW